VLVIHSITVTLTVSVDAGVITHNVEPDQIAWFITDGSIALALAGGGSINNNYVATTTPTIDDDSNQSSPGPYSVGSKWVNLTLDTAYICVDATDGAAVWNQIDASGSSSASQYFSIVSFDYTVDTSVGDGAGYFHIPPDFDGMNLTYVHAKVITAGVTGSLGIQIHNVTKAVDMLSTKITIDTTETGSDTAAVPAAIDVTNDDVATNDLLRIDVDAIHTGTAAKGLLITLGFETP
jgi:hypothetical protein